MEIMATRPFVIRARQHGAALEGRLDDVVRKAGESGQPWAEPVGDGQVLGLSVEGGKVALWFLEPEAREPATEPPLSDIRRSELLDLGVPTELIHQLQQMRSQRELETLGLAPAAAARLRFLFVQKLRGIGTEPHDLTRCAAGTVQLEDLLRGRITDLLLNLDATQRRIVELEGRAPIVVKGVAGSGKTSVAIHRVHHLLRQRTLFGRPRILYLTYNRALAQATIDLLTAVGVRANEVEVRTVHRWCFRFAKLPRGLTMMSEKRQMALVRKARASVEPGCVLSGYPDGFWRSELHLVRSRVTAGEDEYLAMERHGAGRPLSADLRRIVWTVSQEYERLCRQAKRMDFDGLLRATWHRLEKLGDAAPRYDCVIVDEGQDLSPLAFRIVSRLVRDGGEILVTYDPAQSIYEQGFRWKDCGIAVHGSRSFTLTANHRNTREILESALPLLGAMRCETDQEEATLHPDAPGRHGPKPRRLRVAPSLLYPTLVSEIRRRIETDGIPPQNIAVLAARNVSAREAHQALVSAGVLSQRCGQGSDLRLSDPSVKVCTMHSAKGLEWPVVYLLAGRQDLEAPEAAEEIREHKAKTRRLIYMAMTRAIADLVVLSTKRGV